MDVQCIGTSDILLRLLFWIIRNSVPSGYRIACICLRAMMHSWMGVMRIFCIVGRSLVLDAQNNVKECTQSYFFVWIVHAEIVFSYVHILCTKEWYWSWQTYARRSVTSAVFHFKWTDKTGVNLEWWTWKQSTSSNQGAVAIERCRLTTVGIPMLKTRRSPDRLVFNMGIPIHGEDGLYIETKPWS